MGIFWMPIAQAMAEFGLEGKSMRADGNRPAIVVPYRNGYYRAYVINHDGSAHKFAPQAKDLATRSRPYVRRPRPNANLERLYLDESDLRAVLGRAHNELTIGLNGAAGFFDTKYNNGDPYQEILDALAQPTLKEVIFRLDGDVARNAAVRGAYEKAARWIVKNYPNLKVGRTNFPDNEDGSKNGFDDMVHKMGYPLVAQFFLRTGIHWWKEASVGKVGEIVNLADLRNQPDIEIDWLVQNLLPAKGCFLLIGGPKQGKSWLAMLLCLCVLTGQVFLGANIRRLKRVLYINVDDPVPRRFAQRINEMDGAKKLDVTRLDMVVEWPRGDPGVDALEAHLATHKSTKLVIVDAFLSFRASRSKRMYDLLEEDYEFIKKFQVLANARGILILVLIHTRKRKTIFVLPENPFDEVQATGAVLAACDGMLALDRVGITSAEGMQLGMLFGRGRDVADWNLGMEIRKGRWEKLGTAQDALSTPERAAITTLMRTDDERVWTAKQVAEELGRQVKATSRLMVKMREGGVLVSQRGPGGGYRLAKGA
jgi:hypothetical protein